MGDESLVAQCAVVAQQHDEVEVVAVATTDDEVRREVTNAQIATVAVDELGAVMAAGDIDILFSIANERVLSDEVLAAVRHAVNFHDGPLPELAGLGVTTWAIYEDRPTHGVTWHRMTAEVDAGEVLVAERFPIAPADTALSLNARCFEAGLATFPAVLHLLLADPAPGVGEPPERTIGRYERPVAWLDPSRPAADLARAVRSLAVGPRVRNRVGAMRWIVAGRPVVVREALAVDASGHEPGSVVSVDQAGVRLATVDGDLLITSLDVPDVDAHDLVGLAEAVGLHRGAVVAAPPTELVAALAMRDHGLARAETHWLGALAAIADDRPDAMALPLHPHGSTVSADPVPLQAELDAPSDDALVAAVGCWWSLLAGSTTVAVADGLGDDEPLATIVCPPVVEVVPEPRLTVEQLVEEVAVRRTESARRGAYLIDLPLRGPGLGAHAGPQVVVRRAGSSWAPPSALVAVEVEVDPTHRRVQIATLVAADAEVAAGLAAGLSSVLAALGDGSRLVGEIDLLDDGDRSVIDRVNATAKDHDRAATLDGAIRAQAARTPDAPAVSDTDRTLSYRELMGRADALAATLHARGVGRGDLVGIALERDVDLFVGVVGVLASGAAYVPLDPDYPEERIRAMAADAGLAAVLATPAVAARLDLGVTVLHPADVAKGAAAEPAHTAADPAYVIYTSGSTGTPKGVVLEHRNVTNFFAAMDDVIDHDDPGTWLAVTSLSFDISVLELVWTLTRGFHVVIHRRTVGAASAPAAAPSPVRAPSWSFFFFAAGDEQAAEGYRLLLDTARFGDRHGFEAVWVPERHFHAFGAAYPNPSVAGAAVAAVTSRIGIRAGSVVLPLHATARVAEEWAVVDNLSGGRVGISFAAGWQPRDFVLNPGAYATARADLAGKIDEVRRLWRGEAVALAGHDGEPTPIVTLPRPVQAELPTWMTSAGSTSTFEEAGRLGHNVLTHLLGQSIEQLGANIAAYRSARLGAGHQGPGQVTLMLHTHIDRDQTVARTRAEEPMRGYLRTATGLIKNMASSFPTFAGAGGDADEAFRSLTDDEMEQLLTVAAERYMETSGLFTTPEGAADLVAELAGIGVDEVGCLVDFGIETDDVLASLDLIAEAKVIVDDRLGGPDAPIGASGHVGPAEAPGVGAVIERFSVTHLQCTPSLAEILLADPSDAAGLARLRHLMVGGEALPVALAAELVDLVPGRLTNMYGPTETTIWSLVHEIDEAPTAVVPIGRPIANTTVHVLDELGRRRRVGELGELHIGGEGVARGYLHRRELTAERFVDRPGMGRLYATGDLVRLRHDGVMEFAGRVDFQVKIRGHRIELGEIEDVLESDPSVDRAVVATRGEGAEARLVAFVRPSGRTIVTDELLGLARRRLPDVMVPDLVHEVAAFALTPNGKIDRSALPDDVGPVARELDDADKPIGGLEEVVAAAWAGRLGHPLARTTNVFEAGGNSLLAVAVFRELQAVAGPSLVLTDLFRHPTIAALAGHLDRLVGSRDSDEVAGPQSSGAERGARRRQARLRGGGRGAGSGSA